MIYSPEAKNRKPGNVEITEVNPQYQAQGTGNATARSGCPSGHTIQYIT